MIYSGAEEEEAYMDEVYDDIDTPVDAANRETTFMWVYHTNKWHCEKKNCLQNSEIMALCHYTHCNNYTK